MQTNLHADPIHQRILVPLGALIALAAATLAAAVISLVLTAPADLTQAVSENGAASVIRGLVALVVEAFWWLLDLL